MAQTRRKLAADFREGAVRLVRETGKPIAQVAARISADLRADGDLVVVSQSRAERVVLADSGAHG